VSQLLEHFEVATPRGDATDVEGMRTTLLSTIALATLAIGASPAAAQLSGGGDGGAPQVSGGGSGGVEIVGPEDMKPVATDITISDAAGTATKTLSCEWTEPQEDDMPCIRFQGDPQTAFAAIEEAGGVRADQVTKTDGSEMEIAYSKRADGTWLIRSKGTIDGTYMHFGRVCTADGQKCQMWDADGAKLAPKKVRAAAAKLRSGKIDSSKRSPNRR
jgi:hypothetical protein